jgi:hypothetical protein
MPWLHKYWIAFVPSDWLEKYQGLVIEIVTAAISPKHIAE